MAQTQSDRFSDETHYGALGVRGLLEHVSKADKRDRAVEGRKTLSANHKEVAVNHTEIQSLKKQREAHNKEMLSQANSRSEGSSKVSKKGGKGDSKVEKMNNVETETGNCFYCNSSDHQIGDCPTKKDPLTGSLDEKKYRHPKHGNGRSICVLCLHAGVTNSDGTTPHHQPIRGDLCPMSSPKYKNRMEAALAEQSDSSFWERLRKDLKKEKIKEASAPNTGVLEKKKKKRRKSTRSERKKKLKEAATNAQSKQSDAGASVEVNSTLALQKKLARRRCRDWATEKKVISCERLHRSVTDIGRKTDFIALLDTNYKKEASAKNFFEMK